MTTPLHTLSPHLSSSKQDYCNSLFLKLPPNLIIFGSFSTLPLEQLLNLPNSATSLLFSGLLHWIKIQQHIEYKVLSITYKTLQSGKPSYLHSLLNVQSKRTTRSSDVITQQRPSVRSHIKITDRSFIHHALLGYLFNFGTLFPNNSASPRRNDHSVLQLILLLHLPLIASVSF